MTRESAFRAQSAQFAERTSRQALVYLDESAAELAAHPPAMLRVRDLPNRYLVGLLAMKVVTDQNHSAPHILKSKGALHPVWLKVDNGTPFIEFYLAHILSDAGIEYDSQWGANIPEAVIEKARSVLRNAVSEKNPGLHVLLEGLTVFANRDIADRARNDVPFLEKILKDKSVDRGATCQSLFR